MILLVIHHHIPTPIATLASVIMVLLLAGYHVKYGHKFWPLCDIIWFMLVLLIGCVLVIMYP